MAYELTKDVLDYLEASVADAAQLLEDLCAMPAPSHLEDERASFVLSWLEGIGATGAYIDEAKNVVLPIACEGKSDIVCFAAHTDTVFPMETPLVFKEEDGKTAAVYFETNEKVLKILQFYNRSAVKK